jgi:hypothetical protein
MSKIDITSTAIEKGIDLAKDFLDKLIMPSVEETGLLLRDKVTLWRFRNQVKILNKSKAICEKHKISPKMISLKLLCPLLDYAGLEEDETLQDKWAILLANMVDSEQNIENHVFPYLLSQISNSEFFLLENVVEIKKNRIESLTNELDGFRKTKPKSLQDLLAKIKPIELEIQKRKDSNISNPGNYQNYWQLEGEKMGLKSEIRKIEEHEKELLKKIVEPEFVPAYELEDYEISNLIRLGVIKAIQNPYAYVGSHNIRNQPNSEYLTLEDLEITIESEDDEYILTELGDMFIKACSEKK